MVATSFINEHFVWWLIPCSRHRHSLQETIDTLASRHDAVSFTPHITLGPPFASSDDPPQLFSSTGGLVSISPSQMRVATGDRFTQCVFLRFDQDIAGLEDLRQQVLDVTGAASDPDDRFPHLSLLYKQSLVETDANRIAESLSLEQLGVCDNPLVFDTLQLMRINLPVETNEDVRKWECVETVRLLEKKRPTRKSRI